MSDKGETGVLIAGGGPVGLALAVELGLRGVDCVLVEKRDGSLPVPKMSQVSTRNMEFCRRWGIAEEVKSAVWSSTHSMDFVYLVSLTGDEIARLRVASYVERGRLDYTPEGPCHCPQIYFDPIVAKFAASLPGVTLRYNTALTGFDQDEDGVTARLVDSVSGREEALRTQYLVGCDGAGGVVRDTLGIELDGLGVIANSVNIFFRSPGLATLHDKGWARFYRVFDEDGCWGELIPIDGVELWRLTVFDDPSPEIDAAHYLRKLAGVDFEYEVINVQSWERRDYVARKLRKGRVLIAGDTAQQCSPTGGLGMHTGVCEAVNIAWKLTALIEGWGGPALLDSYDIECLPVAARNVAISTQSFRNITGLPGRAKAAEALTDRPDAPADGSRMPLGHLSVSDFFKVQVCYEGSPICVPDGTDPPPDDPRRFVPSARPGTRAPHGWIAGNRSVLDLFGTGFTLLRFGDRPPDATAIVAAAEKRGVPLAVHDVPNRDVAALYERSLVLVRPDGHVAWRGDECPADAGALMDVVRGIATLTGSV